MLLGSGLLDSFPVAAPGTMPFALDPPLLGTRAFLEDLSKLIVGGRTASTLPPEAAPELGSLMAMLVAGKVTNTQEKADAANVDDDGENDEEEGSDDDDVAVRNLQMGFLAACKKQVRRQGVAGHTMLAPILQAIKDSITEHKESSLAWLKDGLLSGCPTGDLVDDLGPIPIVVVGDSEYERVEREKEEALTRLASESAALTESQTHLATVAASTAAKLLEWRTARESERAQEEVVEEHAEAVAKEDAKVKWCTTTLAQATPASKGSSRQGTSSSQAGTTGFTSPGGLTSPGGSTELKDQIAMRLGALKGLRAENHITEEEYQAKRQKVLEQLEL